MTKNQHSIYYGGGGVHQKSTIAVRFILNDTNFNISTHLKICKKSRKDDC